MREHLRGTSHGVDAVAVEDGAALVVVAAGTKTT